VTVALARGLEDTAIALDLSVDWAAERETAALAVSLLGMPDGARLSAGLRQADGSWVLTPEELRGLSLTPPPDFAGTLDLRLRAVAEAGGEVASDEATFTVKVAPVVDGAVLAGMAAGSEDQWIALRVDFGASPDGSEAWDGRVVLRGVPEGAVLSQGEDLGGGAWAVEREALAAGAVAIRPPANSDAPITLRLEAVLRDTEGEGAEALFTAPLEVRVAALADAPLVMATDATGREDAPVALDLSAALTDLDGSEVLTLSLLGVPEGARLSAGTRLADGSWRLSPGELAGLTLAPPADFSGTLALTLRATAREANGDAATSEARFTLRVAAVADPVLFAAAGTGDEDNWIPLRGTLALRDPDGSERFAPVITLRGLPPGAALSHGTETAPGIWEVPIEVFRAGTLALRPPPDSDATLHLILSVVSFDDDGAAGDQRVTETEAIVTVRAVADAPLVTVADFQGQEDQPLRLAGLGGALRDTDGSETLHFVLSGLPSGATLSAGTRRLNGEWELTPAQLAGLSMAPPAHFSGSFTLTLTAVATEGAKGRPSASSAARFTISLDPVADNGSIGGKVTGLEDTAIVLRPSFQTPDGDSSEQWSATSEIRGLPPGARLSQGVETAPGVWTVSTGALRAGGITVTPPPDSDADFTLHITATLTDTGNGLSVSRVVTGSHAVEVKAVADAPWVSAASAAGFEDQPIPLSLGAALRDTDGSETLALTILGLPAGASLSHGSRAANGGWIVAAADLGHLVLTPPRDFSGDIALTLRAVASDRDGSTATSTTPFTVRVAGVADAPGLRTAPAMGGEDSAIALRAVAWTTDLDGSESIIGFRVAGLPEGAVLRAGGNALPRQADGSVLVSPDQMGSLTVTPPPHSGRDFTLRVSAISAEPNGSQADSAPQSLPVRVRVVADAPVITGTGGVGQEDGAVPLDLSAHLVDADGSERLSLLLSGLPPGARLTAGTPRGGGTWSLTPEEARGLALLPPPDFAGTFSLTLTAVAQEDDGGAQAVAIATLPVRIAAVVDRPAVGGLDGASGDWGHVVGLEDRPILLPLDPRLTDRDGSERVVGSVTLDGLPPGAVLRLADGSVVAAGPDGLHRVEAARMAGLTLTLPPDQDGAVTLTLQMMVEDTGGVRQEIGGTLVVEARGLADAPLLLAADTAGPAHGGDDAMAGWVALPVSAALRDTDGSETLFLWVRDVPEGFTLSAGTPAGEGAWLVPGGAVGGLAIRPPAGFSGEVPLRLEAVAVERGGDQAGTPGALRLTILPPGGTGGGTGGGGDGSTSPPPATPGEPGAPPPATPADPVPSPLPSPPALRAEAGPGQEDTALALHVTLAGEAGAALGLRVEGMPPGARLSAGLPEPETGAWVLRPDELEGLRFLPPADFSGEVRLLLRALAVGPEGRASATAQPLHLAVEAVADEARIIAAPPLGREGAALPLNLSVLPGDADGSEHVVAVRLSGLPAGARLSGGGVAENGDGTWSADPARLEELWLLPPPGFSGSLGLTVEATTREAVNGAERTTSRHLAVDVAPVPDAPLVTVADVAGREDQPIPLALSAALLDLDGSESLSVVLEGMPAGSRLSAGVNNGDGSWTLRPAQLSGLTLTPPRDWSGRMELTLAAHAMEGADGGMATTRATFQVAVAGAADLPLVDAAPEAAGTEDGVLPIDLRARLTDADGSESLVLRVTGVPAGGRFTAGADNGDGSWTIPGAALPGLGFQAPPDFSGTLRLGFAVMAVEADGDTATHPPFDVTLTVRPVTDAPVLTLRDGAGLEDVPLALSIAAAPADADGSEQLLRVILGGVPAGATLSAGSRAADGNWVLRPDQLAGLTLTPPRNFSGTLQLSVTAVAAERATGVEASSTGRLVLQVEAAADAPLLTVSDATGLEDQPLTLAIRAALSDADGSERLRDLHVTGLPEGFALSAGGPEEGGWRVPPGALAGLRLLPPPDWHGSLRLRVEAVSEEGANGATASTARDFTVTVAPVNDAPHLALEAAGHATREGEAEAAVLGAAQATDPDSPLLSGAVVTLGGAREGDRLAFEGYALEMEDGHAFLGGTGIALVGGGYDVATGTLTLRGAAPPETYAAVLRALVLENDGPGGLAPGTRSIGVVLQDDAGAESARQSVALTVEEAPPFPFSPNTLAEEAMAGSGLLTEAAHGLGAASGWTEQLDHPATPQAAGSDWTATEGPGDAADMAEDQVMAHSAAIPGDEGLLADALAERPPWS